MNEMVTILLIAISVIESFSDVPGPVVSMKSG